MKRLSRNTRGITLIALVITIIVLLILAGVALSLVLGEDGIVNRATNSGKTHNLTGAKEKVELLAATYGANYYEAKYVNNSLPAGTNTIGDFVAAELLAHDNNTSIDEYTLVVSGKSVTLNLNATPAVTGTVQDNGTILWTEVANSGEQPGGNEDPEEPEQPAASNLSPTELAALTANGMAELTSADIDNDSNLTSDQKTALKDTTKVKAVLSGNVPVPVGYDYMTGTSTADGLTKPDGGSWGVVIKDGNDNEWVWVPVNSNENVDPSEIYEEVDNVNVGQKENKKKNVQFARDNKGFRIASLNGLNGLRLASSSSSSEEESYLTTVTTTKKGATILSGYDRGDPNDTLSYREPAILGYYDGDYYDQAGFSSLDDMAEKIVEDYEAMITSISNYGGFFVGRYELSGTNNGSDQEITNPNVQAGQAPMDSVNWYRLYQACRTFGDNSITTSTMIWGTQWDLVCNWTQKKGDQVSYSQYHSSAHSRNNGATTGSNSNDLRNNIFDLEDSRYELTQEADSNLCRAFRGGNCSSNSGRPASYRNYFEPGGYDVYVGSRPTLYIN